MVAFSKAKCSCTCPMLHIANSVNLLSLSLSLSLSQRSQIFCLFNTELEDKFKYSFTFGEFLKAFANFRNFKDLEYFQHTLGKSFCYWLILIVVIDQVLNKYSCHLVTLVKSVQVSRQSDVTLVSFY